MFIWFIYWVYFWSYIIFSNFFYKKLDVNTNMKWSKEKRKKYYTEYYHKKKKYSHNSIMIIEFIQQYYYDYDVVIDYQQAEEIIKNSINNE